MASTAGLQDAQMRIEEMRIDPEEEDDVKEDVEEEDVEIAQLGSQKRCIKGNSGWWEEEDDVEEDVEEEDVEIALLASQKRWIKGNKGWWKLTYETTNARDEWSGLRFKFKEEAGGHPPNFDPEAFDYGDVFAGLQNILEDVSSFAVTCDLEAFLKLFPSVLKLVTNSAPRLEHVEISGYQKVNSTPKEFDIGEILLEAGKSGKLSGLSSLSLTDVDIDNTELQSLAALIETGQCSSLSQLSLDDNIFGSEGMKSLAASLPCLGSSLRHLSIRANRKMGPAGHRALAQAMESGHLLALETLCLENSDIGIYGARICEAYAKALSSGNLQALKEIDLQYCYINDKGAEALASGFGSKAVKNLAVIRLDSNSIGDKGMIALAKSFEIGGFFKLTELKFGSNWYTHESIPALVQALQSGNLQSLTVIGFEHYMSNGHPKMREKQASDLLSAFSTDTAPKVTSILFPWHRFPQLKAQYEQLVERNRMLTGRTVPTRM